MIGWDFAYLLFLIDIKWNYELRILKHNNPGKIPYVPQLVPQRMKIACISSDNIIYIDVIEESEVVPIAPVVELMILELMGSYNSRNCKIFQKIRAAKETKN